MPLEDLRDGISPLRVLHAAVHLAGIADTGPLLPYLANVTDAKQLADIETRRQGACSPPTSRRSQKRRNAIWITYATLTPRLTAGAFFVMGRYSAPTGIFR